MKFNKYLSLAIVSVMGAGFATSCDDAKDNDSVQEYEGAPGVYFSPKANSYLELSEDASTITYPVYRDEPGEELTVTVYSAPVQAYENDDIYTFPSSVTFAKGATVADFVIGYDISKAPKALEQQYELTLDAEPNPFASNTIVITLVNPATWVLLEGKAQYYDYFLPSQFDANVGPYSLDMWRQVENPNVYRLANPYAAVNESEEPLYMTLQVLSEGDIIFGQATPEDGIVYFSETYVGFDEQYGDDMYFVFPGTFSNTNDPSYWVYNRVWEYQDNGMPGDVTLAGWYYMYNVGGFNYATSPSVEIFFPGYTPVDGYAEVEYMGVITPTSQEQSVLLNVTELGSDVSEARAAVAFGTNADALVDAVIAGSVDYTGVAVPGFVYIPFKEDNETGTYTWVVITYVDGEPYDYESGTFYYISSTSDYNPNAGWDSLGYTLYTDGFFVSVFDVGTPYITYPVEIQENSSTPGLYRLVNPYGTLFASMFTGGISSSDTPPCYLTIDATNPNRVKLMQDEQPLVVSTSQGNIQLLSTWSEAGYYENEGMSPDEIASYGMYGTMVDNVITFPLGALDAMWTGDDDYYSANFAIDSDELNAGNYDDPFYKDEEGNYIAPFEVDLNYLFPSIEDFYPDSRRMFNLNSSFRKFNKTGFKVKMEKKAIKSKYINVAPQKNIQSIERAERYNRK